MKSILTLKSNIAKLRREQVEQLSKKGGGGQGFGVRKTGDAVCALVGFPSVGKSTLLNYLTEGHTDSKVAAYDFTTVNCIPGIVSLHDITVQLLDLPGIIHGASAGKGRGREVLSALRSVDMILIVLDFKDDGTLNNRIDMIRQELYNFGIRLNKHPPKITIIKQPKGGVGVTAAVRLTKMTREDVRTICMENRITNAHVTLYEDASADDLIDAILGNTMYVTSFVAINKVDLATQEALDALPEVLADTDYVLVSGNTGYNMDVLREMMYEKLGLIRIFLKPKGKVADLDKPMIVRKDSTIADVCRKIHKDFLTNFRFAKVWGKSAKHPGQIVHLHHVVQDDDLVSIFLKT